jgi:cytochrome P450
MRTELTVQQQQGSWIQHGLNQLDCEADGLLALVAGSETTASVMRITMLSLLSSPGAYRKLKETVRYAVSEQKVSEPISHEQCKALPYLRVCIIQVLAEAASSQY